MKAYKKGKPINLIKEIEESDDLDTFLNEVEVYNEVEE